jgi:hypothetical protein
MPTSNRVRIEQLIADFEPKLRDAFLAAINDLRANADLRGVIRALEAGNGTGAIDALNLDPAALAPLDRARTEAFQTAGDETAAGLPVIRAQLGARVVIRFDGRNLRAEQWLRVQSSEHVTRILDDQREAIRNALRAGMEAGQNPNTVALDIVGRMNNATGKREGGIIGLTSQQEQFARNARAELLSGDPDELRAYLTRTRRDKRFDALVLKAIADEKPVPAADAARMIQRYKDRLLQLRGENIGRTEALASLHAGQFEALQQVADNGKVDRSAVKRRWSSTGDRKVRDTHVAMDGQVVQVDAPFISPSGARLMFPGDPNGPPEEVINCRCLTEPVIDFLKGIS